MKQILILLLTLCFLCMVACGAPVQKPLPTARPTLQAKTTPPSLPNSEQATPETTGTSAPEAPRIPPTLEEKDGKYYIKLYDVTTEKIEDVEIEEYLCGVVAGEMKNTWPEEALKAQAVLARSFLMAFIHERGHSMYSEDAHISTDILESQAYDPSAVNQNVKDAVKETAGQVLIYEGDFVKGWFHACSGGRTAYAVEGLAYSKGEPDYIQPVDSDESSAPESALEWSAEFTKKELLEGIRTTEVEIEDVTRFEIGEKGQSGRVLNFLADGRSVVAPDLRVALGSTKFRSTWIEEMSFDGQNLKLKGKGYGHGVGMSQWGAYTMADKGAKYDEIVLHYYPKCELCTLWK